MALPPLADVLDLSDWIGEPITEEGDVGRAEGVLRLASALVRSYVGTTWVDESGALETDIPDGVADVVLQVAGRGYTNPDGWANESLDDWRGGQRPLQEWGLYLTASEKSILDGHRPRRPSGIGAISTTKASTTTDLSGWVPTDGGTLFPWY
jgi:hypothetical protein